MQNADHMNKVSKTKIAIGLAVIATFQLLWSLYTTSIINDNASILRSEELPLTSLYYKVLYFDESLTKTTKIASLSGDYSLYREYQTLVNQLDRTLSDIQRIAPTSYQAIATSEIVSANEKLVAMELDAFNYIMDGHLQNARDIVFGEEYEKHKKVYSNGNEKLGDAIKKQMHGNAEEIQSIIIINLVLLVFFYISILILLLILLKP